MILSTLHTSPKGALPSQRRDAWVRKVRGGGGYSDFLRLLKAMIDLESLRLGVGAALQTLFGRLISLSLSFLSILFL